MSVCLLSGDIFSEEKSSPPRDKEKKSSQPKKPKKEDQLEEIVVTATRTPRSAFETPRAITIITTEEIDRRNQLSIIDSLDDQIGLWVEKRTTTTSDPVMRGLSGSNILALIDGNTLSSLWGEGGFAGDDMYGKIDADSVSRIEVVRGPSSVLYGSNALGGVVNFILKPPPLSFTHEGWEYGGRTKTVYGSAANEGRFRQEFFGASPQFRFITGFSARDVNDVVAGRGVGLQVPTGGEDYNADFKGEYQIAEDKILSMSIQDVHRVHIRRFYRPTQDNINDRESVTLKYEWDMPSDMVKLIEFNLYYQDKQDQRRWKDTGNRGIAVTKTYALGIQAVKTPIPRHKFTGGLTYQRDDGESPDDEQFTITTPSGAKTKAAPDSIWEDYGIYLQDEWEVRDDLSLIISARYDRFDFESKVDQYYQPPGGWDP